MPVRTLAQTEKKEMEFGGSLGNLCIILFSHFLLYYLWIALTYHDGALFLPASSADFALMGRQILQGASPTLTAAAIYIGFVAFQAVLAWTMPGLKVKGLPIPSEGNQQLTYRCNGITCWYVTLGVAALLHFTGLFPLSRLADHFGSVMTIAILFANLLSLGLYLIGLRSSQGTTSGSRIYDFFMGSLLNPRIGRIDLKLFSEIRVPWILLFFLTLSAAAKQHELTGAISGSMWLMILAHGLYVNACMKGEECIPTTWDIFREKFGWMLVFWNYAGVPCVYCFQSFYILKNNPQLPLPFIIFLFVLLLGAYYVWDTANSQKNRFRMQQRGTFVPRWTFPQLPWGTLKNPRYLKTQTGDALLTDGWYRYGRKIHYTADTVMALVWAMSCGFSGILPYFYPLFFILMITHRYQRDMKRCANKYGSDWETYCQQVPYKFIPLVY